MITALHLDLGARFRGGQRQLLLLAEAQHAQGLGPLVITASEELARALAARDIAHRRCSPNPVLELPTLRRLAASRSLVHAHDARAHGLGAALGRPLLVHRRVDDPPGKGTLSRWKYRRGSFVSVSHAVDAVLAEAGVPTDRRRVVHSGVPIARARSEQDRGGPLRLLTLGALVPHKGHIDLLHALADPSLGPWELDVWGDGPLRAELLRASDALPGPVRFRGDPLGALPDFGVYDLLLHPSRTEGLGTAVLDAQMAGVPVLASSAGGLPEAVAPSGVLSPPRRPEALAVALRGLQAEPRAALRARGDAARAFVQERFSVAGMRDGVADAYASLLRPGTVPP